MDWHTDPFALGGCGGRGGVCVCTLLLHSGQNDTLRGIQHIEIFSVYIIMTWMGDPIWKYGILHGKGGKKTHVFCLFPVPPLTTF